MDNPNITTMRVILFAQRTAMKLHSKNEWKSLDKTFYQGNIFLASEFAWSTYYALVAKLSYVFVMNPRQHSTKRCWWCIHYLFADGYRPKHNKNQQKPVSEKLLGSLLRAHAWLGLKQRKDKSIRKNHWSQRSSWKEEVVLFWLGLETIAQQDIGFLIWKHFARLS